MALRDGVATGGLFTGACKREVLDPPVALRKLPDLRSAQTNYYASIYDALIAKVDFEKAAGTLKK